MRALRFLVLLCLCIDFSNPMLPGAVRLEPGESVDAVHTDRPRVELPTTRLPSPSQLQRLVATEVRGPSAPATLAQPDRPRRFQATRIPAPPDPPPASAGDH